MIRSEERLQALLRSDHKQRGMTPLLHILPYDIVILMFKTLVFSIIFEATSNSGLIIFIKKSESPPDIHIDIYLSVSLIF